MACVALTVLVPVVASACADETPVPPEVTPLPSGVGAGGGPGEAVATTGAEPDSRVYPVWERVSVPEAVLVAIESWAAYVRADGTASGAVTLFEISACAPFGRELALSGRSFELELSDGSRLAPAADARHPSFDEDEPDERRCVRGWITFEFRYDARPVRLLLHTTFLRGPGVFPWTLE